MGRIQLFQQSRGGIEDADARDGQQALVSTGGDGSNYTYSMPRFRAYVMYQDKGLVSRASGLAQRVINGETLTDADVAT